MRALGGSGCLGSTISGGTLALSGTRTFNIGDFVRLEGKTAVMAKITYSKASTVHLEQLDVLSKTRNKFVTPLLSAELVFLNKKMEVKMPQIKSKLNVLLLSAFVKQFFDFELRCFNTDKIQEEKAMLVRLGNQTERGRVNSQIGFASGGGSRRVRVQESGNQ